MTNLEQQNKEIGFRIRSARKAKRLNQTEFAKLLDKSLRTVQKYESGEIEVSVAVIKDISKILECSPSYLLGLDDENRLLEKLSDVVRFVFELDKTNELKFNIDVKKPPNHDGWECSITFDGKNQEGKLNTDFCLFLEEFEKMRDAVSALKTTYLQIANKIVSKETVKEKDYNDYKKCLDTLNEATKSYIQKKGITPKTSKGLERQAAALSIENRVEELIANFETDIKLDSAKVKNAEDLPEQEHSEEIGLE